MLGTIESFTLKLEALPEGVIIATDIVGVALRQHIEFTLKFGAVTNLKDVNPPLALAYPATLTIVPLRDDSLNLSLTYADGSGISSIRFDVSSDGNTLTETNSDLNDARVVFDKQP
jgi:hypothetical protein